MEGNKVTRAGNIEKTQPQLGVPVDIGVASQTVFNLTNDKNGMSWDLIEIALAATGIPRAGLLRGWTRSVARRGDVRSITGYTPLVSGLQGQS